MYIIKLSFLTAVGLLSCAQNQAKKTNPKVTVTRDSVIVIINKTNNNKAEFRYFDYYGNSELAPFPKSGILYIKDSHPIVAYNTNGGDFSDVTYYTFSPKDTITLSLNNGKEVLTTENQILKAKIELLSLLFFNATTRNYPRTSDFKTGMKFTNNNYLNKKRILENNKNKIGFETYLQTGHMIEYDKLASIITLYTKFNKKNDTILNSLKNADSTVWNDMTFRNVISDYDIYIKKVYQINSPELYINYLRKNFPAAIQDYAIFYYLNDFKPDNKIKLAMLDKYVTEFNKQTRYRDFANDLKANLKKYNDNFNAKNSVQISLLTQSLKEKPVSFELLINQNKGKLIYLDFWASWCAPCLAEMPYSTALSVQYSKEKIPIVFIYLSKDENMTSWLNKSKQLNISQSESFVVLNNDAFKKFSNKYSLKAIPRYMIIGKKGEMLDPDALRPSDPKLKEQLAKLLN